MGIAAHNSICTLYSAGPVIILRPYRYKDISQLIRDAHAQGFMGGAAFELDVRPRTSIVLLGDDLYPSFAFAKGL